MNTNRFELTDSAEWMEVA
jgi:hypothetical protein